MPSRDEHLKIARMAEAAVETNASKHPEWAVTMLFYAGLHYIEAYWDVMYAALGCDQHYENHKARREPIQMHLSAIYPHYRALERNAHDARYRGAEFTELEVNELRTQRLEPLRNHVLNALRPPREGGQRV